MIVARALTEASVDDATTGIALIEAVDGALGRVTADAAYDTISFYEVAGARGATVVVPPTSTAHVSRHGPRSSARDRTILAVVRLEFPILCMTATLCGPGDVRAVIAEHLLLKQQLLVVHRPRQRAPHLTASDRRLFGFGSLFLSPGRIRKIANCVRPPRLRRRTIRSPGAPRRI